MPWFTIQCIHKTSGCIFGCGVWNGNAHRPIGDHRRNANNVTVMLCNHIANEYFRRLKLDTCVWIRWTKSLKSTRKLPKNEQAHWHRSFAVCCRDHHPVMHFVAKIQHYSLECRLCPCPYWLTFLLAQCNLDRRHQPSDVNWKTSKHFTCFIRT